MPIDSGNLALKGLDDLFFTEENRQEEQREQVRQKQKMHWKPWKSSSYRHRKNTKKPPKQQSVATTSATSCSHGRMCMTLPITMNAVPSCSNSLRRFASEKTMRSRLR